MTPAQAVKFALGHCFEKESLVPERELVRVALLHGLGSVSAEEVRPELDRQGVLTGEMDGRRMATTRDVQQEEAYIVTWASQGLSPSPRSACPRAWRAASSTTSNGGGARAAVHLGPGEPGRLGGRHRQVHDARGVGPRHEAGRRSRHLPRHHGGAVKVLQKDGLDADTVARFLRDEKMQDAAEGGRVVVDEASMVGHRDAYKLFRLADELDLKLVFVGDPRQHGSVCPRGVHAHSAGVWASSPSA